MVALDSVARRGSGHTPSQKHSEYWDGDVKWVSLADSSALDKGYIQDTVKKVSTQGIAKSSAVIHPKGAVIVSRDAGVGKSTILGDNMAVSQHFIAWVCDEEKLCPEYLYQWLQSHQKIFERMAVGSTIKTIGLGYFKRLKIPLPGLQTQTDISRTLFCWDAAIDKIEQLISAKEEKCESELLRAIVAAGGRTAKFGDFLNESREPSREQDPAKRITVRLHLKGVEARNVRGTEGDGATIYYRRRAGQLIYGKQNVFRGAIGLIPKELDGYSSSQDLPAFDINGDVESQWLLLWMSRNGFYKTLEALAAGSGSKRLSPHEFFKVPIQVPDARTQKAISRYFIGARREISLLEEQAASLRVQKRGLMKRLFTGSWRFKASEAGAT